MCRSPVPRPRATRPVLALIALSVLGVGMSGSAAGAAGLAAAVTAPQGGTITISGNVSVSDACPGGLPVQVTATPATGLFPNGLGPKAPRDANGNFQAVLAIPATATVGSYTIGVTCAGVPTAISEVLQVTASARTPAAIAVTPATAPVKTVVTISGVIPTAGNASCPAGVATQLVSSAALFPPSGAGPQAPRNSDGSFKVTYTVPASTAPGKYTVGVRCGGGNLALGATLQVTAAATTTTAPATTTTSTPPTTTTVPTTSTTSAPSTTLVPFTTTTGAATTTTTPLVAGRKSTKTKSPLRWVALGVLALVVAGAALVFAHQGPAVPPPAEPPAP